MPRKENDRDSLTYWLAELQKDTKDAPENILRVARELIASMVVSRHGKQRTPKALERWIDADDVETLVQTKLLDDLPEVKPTNKAAFYGLVRKKITEARSDLRRKVFAKKRHAAHHQTEPPKRQDDHSAHALFENALPVAGGPGVQVPLPMILELLATLSPVMRAIYVRRVIGKEQFASIASRLGMTTSAVQKQFYSAQKRFDSLDIDSVEERAEREPLPGVPASLFRLCRNSSDVATVFLYCVYAKDSITAYMNAYQKIVEAANRHDSSAAMKPNDTFADYRLIKLMGVGTCCRVWQVERVNRERDPAAVLPGLELSRAAELARTGTIIYMRPRDHGLPNRQRLNLALKIVSAEGWWTELPPALASSGCGGFLHPNLLRAGNRGYDDGGWLYIELERATGTLDDVWKAERKKGNAGIQRTVLLSYLEQVAAGLDHFNSHGFVHRDIKPSNLFLFDSSEGTHVKVGDFGVAEAVDGPAMTGASEKTPAFAAPEFFKGEKHQNSDQYSLAITYIYLLTGHLPFTERLDQKVATKLHLTMLPSGEQWIVAKALGIVPKERWPNCSAFISALLKELHDAHK